MKQRAIMKDEKRCIYLIESEELKFYLVIPNCKKVGLVLNLEDSIRDDTIQNLPFLGAKAIITPVVDSSILDGICQNQVTCFNYLDTVFSKLLNLSHQILTYNHLEVENDVYLSDNKTYSMFHSWFQKKHGGRVQIMDFGLNKGFVMSESVSSGEVRPSQLVKEPPLEKTPVIEDSVEIFDKDMKKNNQSKDLGFVSYVLLGVVVAVLSLVFLYLVI